jgi:hypothetical protein
LTTKTSFPTKSLAGLAGHQRWGMEECSEYTCLQSLLEAVDTSKKRKLMVVGGHADNVVDLCGEDNDDAKRQCLGKGQTMPTKSLSQYVETPRQGTDYTDEVTEPIRRNSIWLPCNNERAQDQHQENLRYVSRVTMRHCAQLRQTQLITLCVQYRFDDEVKDDAHDAFTPEMMKISSRTRSLVSCTQSLHVSTVGLSRDGFTRKGGIISIRN